MSTTTSLRRVFIVVWDWNQGLYPIPSVGFDEWGGEGITDCLVRVDQVNSPEALRFLSERIAAYLSESHVLVFLHTNQSHHRYDANSRRALLEHLSSRTELKQELGRLKINLFGGGNTPIYYQAEDAHCQGFLGNKGNFPNEFQDPTTGKIQKVNVVVSHEQQLLSPDLFRHVWSHYWVNTRQKVYSLMENFRLCTDDFDSTEYKNFTQHLRAEQGLLWPQLAYFTQNKIELRKLPEIPKHEWADFSTCEQHIELAYGADLAAQYRAARETVNNLAINKSHKSPEEVFDSIGTIYNLLDALQDAIPEALSYDTIAHFPR